VTLDSTLSLAGLFLGAVVFGLLVFRRAWGKLPLFFIYSLWTPLSGLAERLVYPHNPTQYTRYFETYMVVTGVDSLLQFCVLLELAWSIFRPFRASLPRHTGWVLGGFMMITGAVIWPFASNPSFAHFPAQWKTQWELLGHFTQTDALLRILLFLILAACSQLLSISWRDRELQIASGLGFYSLVAVVVGAVQSHIGTPMHYLELYRFLVGSYLVSLTYWVFSFAQKEAERREFSPQMQGLLLAVAGAARNSRIAISGSLSDKSRRGRDL
jgi:hypothetical protein